MKVGTKSVLFGVHCFFIHPFFVFAGWWKLYGFPYDPRLWVAFIVHDLGYWGMPNMDGEEGELHPYFGAKIMRFLFGKEWYGFTLYHSRFLAKRENAQYSKLCVADKLAIGLTPTWMYLPMANLTGEIHEYMGIASIQTSGAIEEDLSQAKWHKAVREYCSKWAWEHKDCRQDSWMPETRRKFLGKNEFD